MSLEGYCPLRMGRERGRGRESGDGDEEISQLNLRISRKGGGEVVHHGNNGSTYSHPSKSRGCRAGVLGRRSLGSLGPLELRSEHYVLTYCVNPGSLDGHPGAHLLPTFPTFPLVLSPRVAPLPAVHVWVPGLVPFQFASFPPPIISLICTSTFHSSFLITRKSSLA